jgi:hypothetical protein
MIPVLECSILHSLCTCIRTVPSRSHLHERLVNGIETLLILFLLTLLALPGGRKFTPGLVIDLKDSAKGEKIMLLQDGQSRAWMSATDTLFGPQNCFRSLDTDHGYCAVMLSSWRSRQIH